MSVSKAQIVVTLGPASLSRTVLLAMVEHQMDVARLNFSWAQGSDRTEDFVLIKDVAKTAGRHIPIIVDLPGPREQKTKGHTFDHVSSGFTEHDKDLVISGIKNGADWIAVSFVKGPEDIEACRKVIQENGGKQKIIAKIERKEALESIDSIIKAADAVMVARGDLGDQIPLEQVPFAQAMIIRKCNQARKPVITATEMLLSMVKESRPTRAEVTDVANAILLGSDAVMLSEETAIGAHPVEAVTMMERIVLEAERHVVGKKVMHPF